MKFAALQVPGRPVIGGIESSAGYQLIVTEAEDRAAAEAFCARNRLTYVMPLIPPFGIDRSKDNGRG